MSTFRELYCAASDCLPEEFEGKVLRACLHRPAAGWAIVLGWLFPRHFDPDRELVKEAGKARSLREIEEELHAYRLDARNRSWWRRRARVRISARRLRQLARTHFGKAQPRPENEAVPR